MDGGDIRHFVTYRLQPPAIRGRDRPDGTVSTHAVPGAVRHVGGGQPAVNGRIGFRSLQRHPGSGRRFPDIAPRPLLEFQLAGRAADPSRLQPEPEFRRERQPRLPPAVTGPHPVRQGMEGHARFLQFQGHSCVGTGSAQITELNGRGAGLSSAPRRGRRVWHRMKNGPRANTRMTIGSMACHKDASWFC